MKVAGIAPMQDEPKEVICNRPYVYAIVDTVTMNPVFIGTVNNVK
jgi:serpin B